jgi:hypothetical protein
LLAGAPHAICSASQLIKRCTTPYTIDQPDAGEHLQRRAVTGLFGLALVAIAAALRLDAERSDYLLTITKCCVS